ncbi:MFS transporter [Prochlorococcus sp. MIT 1307]|uniref:MFS transporter n=1 Tax=Prochlorococcus sp. MIT 1307 TaxID=3096219 RepID=UPI002A74EB51|nr:MFS transporter [Prochlorococcus sp. MIT 1307]
MSVLNTTPNFYFWWNQFPSPLRIIAKIRLLASIGAGGVIYLTPLVFNQIALSATQIGSGLAIAAFVGTLSRLITGGLLDRGVYSSLTIKWAAIVAIASDFFLFNAQNFNAFVVGQIVLGIAAGIYWPGVELAVPASCGKFPSSKGFALVRSADALGTSIGALLGSLAALISAIRMVYLLDTCCMILLLLLLTKNSQKDKRAEAIKELEQSQLINKENFADKEGKWLHQLFPILVLSLLATAIFTLLQSALPLDLVKGGISRPPVSEAQSGAILALQLCLLVLFQWPIGRWLSEKSKKFSLRISFSCFAFGCLLLGLSAIFTKGIILVLISQLPLAFALAAFLPTATEAVIQTPPIDHRGIAMALFSQCFAISALIAPILSGLIIDMQGNGILVWLTMSIACLIMLPLTKKVKTKSINNYFEA